MHVDLDLGSSSRPAARIKLSACPYHIPLLAQEWYNGMNGGCGLVLLRRKTPVNLLGLLNTVLIH